jgi:hypothetical protein
LINGEPVPMIALPPGISTFEKRRGVVDLERGIDAAPAGLSDRTGEQQALGVGKVSAAVIGVSDWLLS